MSFLKSSHTEPQYLNLHHWALATLSPILILILAMAFKPLWRDEYWSLFFSDPSLSFPDLLAGRLRDEVHPPFYYFLLHSWQNFTSHIFGLRFLSPVILIVTAFVLRVLTPDAGRRQLAVFLLICAGSYWVIYYSAEIRPYVLLFSLASISVFLVPKLVDDDPVKTRTFILWTLVGAALGVTHYFGALWFACIGFSCGVAVLLSGHKIRFFTIGFVTLLGLLPVIYWLFISFGQMDLSGEEMSRTAPAEFSFVTNQFLRGLIAKTFGSNPLVTFLGIGGLWLAFRGKDRMGTTLLGAVILTVMIAYTVHFSFVALIKERAFSVIMPAILFIFAGHIANRKSAAMRFLPWVTLIMPVLFWSEYFKNREKIPQLQEKLATYSEVCQGETILAYNAKSSMHEDFNPMASRKIVNFTKGSVTFDVKLIDVKKVNEPISTLCPVKAVGLLMPRRNGEILADARMSLQEAGIALDSVEEIKFGKGRNIIWVEK
jgi:hypothetical protein